MISTPEEHNTRSQAMIVSAYRSALRFLLRSSYRRHRDPASLRSIELVVFDFDGVLTDNTVWTDETGKELVRSDRSDGLGVQHLREAGVTMLVLSTERNSVVTRRCEKLRIDVEQGIANKGERLQAILHDRHIDPSHVAYIGNDVNDADCLRLAGLAVVVADCHRDVVDLADLVLTRRGGHGAVREFCDALLHAREPG